MWGVGLMEQNNLSTACAIQYWMYGFCLHIMFKFYNFSVIYICISRVLDNTIHMHSKNVTYTTFFSTWMWGFVDHLYDIEDIDIVGQFCFSPMCVQLREGRRICALSGPILWHIYDHHICFSWHFYLIIQRLYCLFIIF